MSETPTTPPRPKTVRAAAIIMFLLAAFGILAGIAYLGALGSEDTTLRSHHTELVIYGIIQLVLGTLQLVLGIFILRGRRWARNGALVLGGINGLFGLLGVFAGGGGSSLLSVFLAVAVIWLLAGNEKSKQYFNR